MSAQYIRDYYKVPAKRGVRVRYTGSKDGVARLGTITSMDGQYIRVRLDGDDYSMPYHPVWDIEYLTEDLKEPKQ